jgi:hypothetical protein
MVRTGSSPHSGAYPADEAQSELAEGCVKQEARPEAA